MKARVITLLIASALAINCSGTSRENTREQNMQTIKHPNGLTVRFDSAAMTATQLERGFQFAPADATGRRTPWSVKLTLEPGLQPSGAWPNSRDLAGRRARFRIDTSPGGSAGDLFVLNAWTACESQHIALRVETQAETEQETEFEPGWALLSSATCL